MNTITLNDSIRAAARRNPVTLLTIIGMYAGTGKVNNIDLDVVDQAVAAALVAGIGGPMPVRDDFDTDQAYNDQYNQWIVIRALSTKLNYDFKADNIPAMIDEMYDRMECHEEVWDAYTSLSDSLIRVEDAFVNKAKTELY